MYLYFNNPNNLSKCTLGKVNPSPLYMLYILPQIIPHPTLMLVHTWCIEYTPREGSMVSPNLKPQPLILPNLHYE